MQKNLIGPFLRKARRNFIASGPLIIGGTLEQVSLTLPSSWTAPVSWEPASADAGPAPVRAVWVADGNPWPAATGELRQPGDYEVRFERDDHEPATLPLRVPKAVENMVMKAPGDWVPRKPLQDLRDLQALQKKENWGELARRLTEQDEPVFEWDVHAGQYRAVKDACFSKVAEDIEKRMPQAEAAVREYCESLYQISNPFGIIKFRDSSKLSLSGLPDYPEEAVPHAAVRARYQRLKAWEAATEELGRDDRGSLAARLKELSGELREVDRWRAHREYHRGELRSALERLARAETINEYDLLTGCAAAAHDWDKFLDVVSDAIESGEYYADKVVVERDPQKVRAHVLDNHCRRFQESAERLTRLAARADARALRFAADYFADRQGEAGADLLIRFFQEYGTEKVRQEFGDIPLSEEATGNQEDRWATLKELLSHAPAVR